MKSITHSLQIDAPAERLWQLTIDVERWPSLFPTITSVARNDGGPMRVGASARIKQPGQPLRVWTVTECQAPRRFVWETRGVGFSMRAIHAITPIDGTHATNALTIELAGPLGPVVGLIAGRQIQRVLEVENEGFRSAAQAVAHN